MSTTSHDDRWLLPRRQTEYPARDLLPEELLHARREATFLVLAAIFLVGTSALILLGASRSIDLSPLVARALPSLDLPAAILVPLAALPFAATFIASSLACELFGRRRAGAIVWVGFAAVLALAALMRAADLIDGGTAGGAAIALAGCYALGHAANLIAFDALRRRSSGRGTFVRLVVAAITAQAIGWAAFVLIPTLGAGYVYLPLDKDTLLGLAIGGAASSAAVALVLAIPAALAARGLAIALRVGRDPLATDDEDDEEPLAAYRRAYGSGTRRLPPATIVDDDAAAIPSLQPYSSAEMRFFADGDAS
jgi:uncharacterized PurR-regulated membrane protein YhhQ (DUF165 family)